jgi:hypothetical protein
MDFLGVTPTQPTGGQGAANDKFNAMSHAEQLRDIKARSAVIRKFRKESRVVTPEVELAMRKMLTEELGLMRVRYSTVVTLHRIMSRLEVSPNALISRFDETLGDDKTIRGLQHVLAVAEYLTQAPQFYGNGKATLQAFKGTGKPRRCINLIPSETYWNGLKEFLDYDMPSSMSTSVTAFPTGITEADMSH